MYITMHYVILCARQVALRDEPLRRPAAQGGRRRLVAADDYNMIYHGIVML